MPLLNPSDVRARAWVLLAVDSCDRGGLTPIEKTLFHRLIFLSNCLAELFSAFPPAKRVMKYRRGPFYPDVQWELDRLNAFGFVAISNIKIVRDEAGAWMEADYKFTHRGIEAAAKIKDTPLGNTTSKYIDELVFAFAQLNSRRLDEVALRELNYAAPGIAEGALITFEDAQSNLALRKTADFERILPSAFVSRFREKLQLYLKYIESREAA